MANVYREYDPDRKLTPEELARLKALAKDLEDRVDEYDEDCPPLTEKQLEKMAQIIRDRKKHA